MRSKLEQLEENRRQPTVCLKLAGEAAGGKGHLKAVGSVIRRPHLPGDCLERVRMVAVVVPPGAAR